MLLPPKKNSYEKVRTDDFIPGVIEDIEVTEGKVWKGFKGKPDTTCDGIRFIFKLEGYDFPHGSGWMKFLMGEKANLYKKYIANLVENAKPDIRFDLEELKGMKIKVLYKDNGDYQNVENIRPVGKKKVVKEVDSDALDTINEFVDEFISEDDVSL